MIAWAIAKYLVGHSQPFFAPVAAVVALNASLGERGLNAVRLLLGVVVGIVVGELAVYALGGGIETLALATFAAMAVARALGGVRIVINQAATSAILTVVAAHGEVGHGPLSRRADRRRRGAGVRPVPVLPRTRRPAAPRGGGGARGHGPRVGLERPVARVCG